MQHVYCSFTILTLEDISINNEYENDFKPYSYSKSMRRVQLVCDSPDSLQDKTDYLNNVFSKNNYNTDFVGRNTHSNTDSNTQTNFNSGPVMTATLPYIRGTSETIARILQPYNIRLTIDNCLTVTIDGSKRTSY